MEERERIRQALRAKFSNKELFDIAFSNPTAKSDIRRSKQRLEFLGDSIIEVVLSQFLFFAMPDADEGVLTRIRSYLVSKDAMDKLAAKIGVPVDKKRGKKFACDTVEAFVGALFLDAGMQSASDFVLDLWGPLIFNMDAQDLFVATELLQRIVQKASNTLPEYEVEEKEGKFSCRVYFDGRELGQGKGENKKQAQINAAKSALKNMVG